MANCCVKKLPFIQFMFGVYSTLLHLIGLYLSNNAVRYESNLNGYGNYVHYAPTAALNISAGLICGLSFMTCCFINESLDSTSRKNIKFTALSNIFSIALSLVLLAFSMMTYDGRRDQVYCFTLLFVFIWTFIVCGIISQIIFLIVSTYTP